VCAVVGWFGIKLLRLVDVLKLIRFGVILNVFLVIWLNFIPMELGRVSAVASAL